MYLVAQAHVVDCEARPVALLKSEGRQRSFQPNTLSRRHKVSDHESPVPNKAIKHHTQSKTRQTAADADIHTNVGEVIRRGKAEEEAEKCNTCYDMFNLFFCFMSIGCLKIGQNGRMNKL